MKARGGEPQANENLPMAEFIFTQIKDYGFMQCSYFITNAVIAATELGLPSMLEYLDSRLREVTHTFEQKTQKAIRRDKVFESPSMGEYGMLSTAIWAPEREIKAELFDDSKALQPMTLQYLDIPYIFDPTQEGFRFIDALLKTPELGIFGLKSV